MKHLDFSLSKKPRRARAVRGKEIEICFRPRHVRGRKHFSARKRANWSSLTDSERAAAGRFRRGWGFVPGKRLSKILFRQSQVQVKHLDFLFYLYIRSNPKNRVPWKLNRPRSPSTRKPYSRRGTWNSIRSPLATWKVT